MRKAAGRELTAVGFGVPSLVDARTGVVATTVHLPLRDVPLRDVMAERLGVPVAVDNDANAAMFAEHRRGAARGARTAALLTLGTGIGGGIVVDGERAARRARRRGRVGAHGRRRRRAAVHLRQPRLPGDAGVRDGAGSRGARGRPRSCRTRASGRRCAAGREITGTLATELAHDGDPVARDVVTRGRPHLGVGLSNVINILNPEVIVVGGGVIAAGELLLEPARKVVAERALAPSRDQVRIVPTRFGDASGMVGAALLAMDARAASGGVDR